MGKKTDYTEDLGNRICLRLAEGESLNGICKDEDMPPESTVRGWAVDPEHPISAKYARAREIGFLKMADDLLDIADDGTNDWMDKKLRSGETVRVVDEECVKRSQLRVETRKWIVAKMLPKIYGDKLQVEQKIGFTQEFEAFVRELRGDKGDNGSLEVAGRQMEALPVPLRH